MVTRKQAMGLMAAAIGAGLCACGSQPQVRYVAQRVEVPLIERPPAIEVPPPPHLAIQDLTERSSDAEMMAAWVASVHQLKSDDQRLRAMLVPYARGSEAPGAP
jgi:hypothetical protein